MSEQSQIPSLETIDFQKDDFGPQLEALISPIVEAILKGEKDHKKIKYHPSIKGIQELVFDRLGLKIKLITNDGLAAIMPFYPNRNHIFLNDFGKILFPEDQVLQIKKIQKSGHIEGTVDTKNAKVSGVFSQYTNSVFMNFIELVKYKMTASEITAILLHELGHGFYACEYSDRLSATNQVLADIALKINSDKKDAYNYVYTELSKLSKDITEKEVEKLLSGDKIIPGLVWFETMVKIVNTQLPSKKYNETSFEQLADNFSSRFGYGRTLVSALAKIHDSFSYGKIGQAFAVFNDLSLIFYFSRFLYYLPMNIAYFPIFSVFITIGYIFSLYIKGENSKDYTYDEVEVRYKRIRNDYVELLKNGDIPKEELPGLVNNLKEIDTAIKTSSQYKSILRKLSNLVFLSNKRTRNDIEEQQLLENLAANDLFVKAAELKTL